MTQPKNSIISFDLDMTLLDHSTYSIPPSAIAAVERLKEKHRVIVASGRDMDNYYSREFKEMLKPDAIIHMNGTKVTVGEHMIFDHCMSKELLRELLEFGVSRHLSLGATIGDDDFYTCPEIVAENDRIRWGEMNRNFKNPLELLNMDVRTLAYVGTEEGVRKLEVQFPQMKFPMFAGKRGADCVEKVASKAKGLQRLCEYWEIDLKHTAAFGDSMNDIEIIQEAGIGIAMGNAIEELKEAADYVTTDIDKDGVAQACEHFDWFRFD